MNLLVCMLFCFIVPVMASMQVVVADFSAGVGEGGVPSGWQVKERAGQADFSVVKDGDIHALRLRSADTSFALQKPLELSPRQYPVLAWKWKVTQLPARGDLRRSETDDQAAQLFLAFADSKAIAYIWDTSAPQGFIGDAWAPPFMKIKAVVVRSGPEETGKWISESRNAYQDYKKFFGGEPPHIAGIRIQINSQHTDSTGESYFADVMFKKN